MYVTDDDGANWMETQTLLAPDRAIGDSFGFAIAINNFVVVVGAYADDNENGSNGGNW